MKRAIYIIIFSIYLTINLNATTPTYENVTKLYIATFNRAPDSKGLNYWVYKSHLTLEEIAESFFDQNETKALYPNSYSNRRFIQAIYKNVLGRDPDRAGERYWLNELNSGHIKRSLFILAIVNGALNNDSILLENKTKVGLEFVKSKIDDMKIAKEIMKSVTIDSSIDEVFKKAGFIKTKSGLYIKDNKIDNIKVTSSKNNSTVEYNNIDSSSNLQHNQSKQEYSNSKNYTTQTNTTNNITTHITNKAYQQLLENKSSKEDNSEYKNATKNSKEQTSSILENNSSKDKPKNDNLKDSYSNDSINDMNDKKQILENNSSKKRKIDNNYYETSSINDTTDDNTSKQKTAEDSEQNTSNSDTNSIPLEDKSLKKVGWYMRTVVEADLENGKRYIQSKAGVFGEYIDSIDGRDRHDIPSMGTAILRVVFINPNWENEKSFFSDYRAYRGDTHIEVWTFQVKNDRDVNLANATLKISLKGPYDIYQSQNGNFKEILSNRDNLKKSITLIDVDNSIDYLYGDSQYITLSMDGKHTRTFRWVIGDVKEEDYKPISNIQSRSLIFHKREEGKFGYPPN